MPTPTIEQFSNICQRHAVKWKSIQQFDGVFLITGFTTSATKTYLHAQHEDLKMTMALFIASRYWK